MNIQRATQFIDFTSLSRGVIKPMDIDGVLELHDKYYVFFEWKTGEAPLPYGQRLTYERLVNDLSKAGKRAVCLVCEHHTNPAQTINGGLCEVRSAYHDGKWHDATHYITAQDYLSVFVGEKFNGNKGVGV